MKDHIHNHNARPVISQLQNNSSEWFGHFYSNDDDAMLGQIFQMPETTRVNSISVYSDHVQHAGKVIFSLHQFDHEKHQWGPVLCKTELLVKKHNSAEWLEFDLPGVTLEKNKDYGFRLESSDALVSVGEVAWASRNKVMHGEEWCAHSNERSERYYNYFSLVFSVRAA